MIAISEKCRKFSSEIAAITYAKPTLLTGIKSQISQIIADDSSISPSAIIGGFCGSSIDNKVKLLNKINYSRNKHEIENVHRCFRKLLANFCSWMRLLVACLLNEQLFSLLECAAAIHATQRRTIVQDTLLLLLTNDSNWSCYRHSSYWRKNETDHGDRNRKDSFDL
jgi:hypothetical protein